MTDGTDDGDDAETADLTADAEERPNTVRHDWDQSGEPSVVIVETVAAATDRPTTDLPLLQQHIDPEALDALLTHRSSSQVDITFTYADATVSVSANGAIDIQIDGSPADGDGE